MTIIRDVDDAIAAEKLKRQHGKLPKDMLLRMGIGARQAIAAAATPEDCLVMFKGEPVEYCGIPIEAVPPPGRDEVNSREAFMGWELRC